MKNDKKNKKVSEMTQEERKAYLRGETGKTDVSKSLVVHSKP